MSQETATMTLPGAFLLRAQLELREPQELAAEVLAAYVHRKEWADMPRHDRDLSEYISSK